MSRPFDIFQARIAALGLSDSVVRRLLADSTDALRFVVTPPSIDSIKIGWVENNEARTYLEKSPREMVHLLDQYAAKLAEVRRLTKDAKAELARTREIQAAA